MNHAQPHIALPRSQPPEVGVAWSHELASPLGELHTHWQGELLVGLELPRAQTQPRAEPATQCSALPAGAELVLEQLAQDIACWWAHPAHTWRTAWAWPASTPKQKQVWQAIAEIPCGQTRTYGDLARQLGSSPRAVGQACGRNPLPLLIPCHRVLAAQGLGGFNQGQADDMLKLKILLLQREGIELG